MKRAVLHSEAEAEFDDAMVYYELQRRGLGLELQDEVIGALHRIRLNPELGAPHKRTKFRRQSVHRFPFEVYYQILPDVLWVVAIAHSKRRPDYWKGRLPK